MCMLCRRDKSLRIPGDVLRDWLGKLLELGTGNSFSLYF